MRLASVILALWYWLAGVGAAHATGIETAILAVAGWYSTLGVTGQLLVSVGLSLALSAASYGISYLIGRGGKAQSQAQAEQAQGISLPEYSGLLTVRRAYGEVTVTGGVFFNETVAVGGSAPNHWIFGLAISEGICDSLEAIIINGVECPIDISGNPIAEPWYNPSGNKLNTSFRRGTDTQAIDTIIAARFPSPPSDFYPDASDRVTRWTQFRQRGVCTVVLEMTVGADTDEHTELWGTGGIPELKLRVRGLRVFDRTKPEQDPDDASTWTWSDNATVVMEDFLCAGIGGQVDRDEIDDTLNAESIAIDAQWLPTLDGMERRGRVNGLVSSDESPIDVLSSMLQMNRGTLRKADGAYNIRSDRPATPVATIHRGQWLRDGTVTMQSETDTRATVDGVVLQFYPASRFGESAETAYPASALDDPNAARATFRFGDSAAQVQRLGFAMQEENDLGGTISGLFDISVLAATGKPNRLLEVGDVVWWDGGDPFDDMDGLFTVTGLEIASNFAVSLSLAGTSADIINGWNTGLETALDEVA